MDQAPEKEPFWTRHAALLIAGGYCLISLIYIFTSDRLVLMIFEDPERITFVQSIKGKVFVIVSSLILFVVMHIAFNRVRHARHAELTANEQYRRMIETTNEGVWILDHEGITTFANETMAMMLNTTPEEMIGRPHILFLEEQWHDFAIEQFERRKRGIHDQFECQFSCGDGKTIWVNVSASPLFNPDGEFAGSLRMVTEITRLKNTEEALKASLKSQRQLLNELDHRVRNNLSSLVSLVDISRGGASDVGRFADSIRGRIDAMNRAYGLLSSTGWKRQDFHRLLQVLVPGKFSRRIELAGPHIEFAPYLSGAVAIVFHELIDNAVQHGALSNESGRVGIIWRVVDAGQREAQIEVRWTEGAGPPITDAGPIGTGMQLIRGLIESDLRGSVTFGLPEEGARHVLRMQLDDSKLDEEETSDDLWANGQATSRSA